MSTPIATLNSGRWFWITNAFTFAVCARIIKGTSDISTTELSELGPADT